MRHSDDIDEFLEDEKITSAALKEELTKVVIETILKNTTENIKDDKK